MHLLSPFFFASRLGLIISDQFRRLLEDWPVLYVVAWYSAKPDIERPNDHGHGSTHQSHRATAMSQVTVAERILTQHPRPPVLLTAADGPKPVARLDYLGLLGVWTENRPHIRAWWARAQEWPSFKRALHDRVSEDEFAEMRTHGPEIRAEVAELVAGLRRAEPASTR